MEQGHVRSARVSVVVPVLDGADHLPEFTQRLIRALHGTGWSHQIVLVDDGSTDGTWSFIRELAASESAVAGVRLRRNVGQAAAVASGFTVASGDIVATMDVDLETFPEDLPLLVAPVIAGVDLASGRRTGPRQLRRLIPSRIFNAHARRRGIPLHDLGCGMNAMTAAVAAEYVRFGSIGRGLQKSLLVSLAESLVEVPLRSVRTSGSRFSISGLVDLWVEFDALHASSSSPRRSAIGTMGVAVGVLGLLGVRTPHTQQFRSVRTVASSLCLLVGASVLGFAVRTDSAARRLRRAVPQEFAIEELVGASVGNEPVTRSTIHVERRRAPAPMWVAATAAALEA